MPESRDAEPRQARDGLGLAAILIVAAMLRAFAWSRTTVIFNDGPVFLAMAEAIDAGRWAEVLGHPFHPLYPALIAFVAQAPVRFETAAIGVSIFGGLLSIVGIFLFVRRAFGRDLAWPAAWIVTLHPWAVDFSSDVMSDGLYAGFYLLGFAAMAALVERPRLETALACGLASGLAYLVRPEGVGLLLACGLLLAIKAFREATDRRRIFAALAGLVLAAALVMAPLVGSIAQQTGELSLTRKKSLVGLASGNTEVRLNPERAEGSSVPGGSVPIPLPRSSRHADGRDTTPPPRTLVGMAGSVSLAARTSLAALRYEVAVVALIGVWAVRSRRRFERETTVAIPVILYSGVLVLLAWGAGYVARRHALAALLPLCGYAALGWQTLCMGIVERVAPNGSPRALRLEKPGSICLMLVVVLVVVWGARDLRFRRVEREPLRLASEWLQENTSRDARVAAQKLRVAYYAGTEYVPLPSGNDGRIEQYLRSHNVGWVVIDEGRLGDHLGLEEGVGEWLVPIHSVERAGRRAVVLELRPEPAM